MLSFAGLLTLACGLAAAAPLGGINDVNSPSPLTSVEYEGKIYMIRPENVNVDKRQLLATYLCLDTALLTLTPHVNGECNANSKLVPVAVVNHDHELEENTNKHPYKDDHSHKTHPHKVDYSHKDHPHKDGDSHKNSPRNYRYKGHYTEKYNDKKYEGKYGHSKGKHYGYKGKYDGDKEKYDDGRDKYEGDKDKYEDDKGEGEYPYYEPYSTSSCTTDQLNSVPGASDSTTVVLTSFLTFPTLTSTVLVTSSATVVATEFSTSTTVVPSTYVATSTTTFTSLETSFTTSTSVTTSSSTTTTTFVTLSTSTVTSTISLLTTSASTTGIISPSIIIDPVAIPFTSTTPFTSPVIASATAVISEIVPVASPLIEGAVEAAVSTVVIVATVEALRRRDTPTDSIAAEDSTISTAYLTSTFTESTATPITNTIRTTLTMPDITASDLGIASPVATGVLSADGTPLSGNTAFGMPLRPQFLNMPNVPGKRLCRVPL